MSTTKQAVYSSRTADKFVVRLPDGLRERIADLAKRRHRSMNNEIVALLVKHVDSGEEAPSVVEYQATPWNPQIGQLVRRRDNKRIIGSISKFEDNKLGVMAVIDQLDAFEPQVRQALGLLEPVDIQDVIDESASPIHRALERIKDNG